MIEVFKTDIQSRLQANLITESIHRAHPHYRANVDLEDCDKVLRIQSSGVVDADAVIELLTSVGCHASVLEDNILY